MGDRKETLKRGETVGISSEKGADEEAEDAIARDKQTDTTRLKAKNEAGFPKRADYKSQEEYTAAIGAFRAREQAGDKAAGQKKALDGMRKK